MLSKRNINVVLTEKWPAFPVKASFILLLILSAWVMLHTSSFYALLVDNTDQLKPLLLGYGQFYSALIIILMGGLLTLIGFSRLILSTICGFVFGVPLGITYALSGTILGCILSFYLSRFFLHDCIQSLSSERIIKLNKQFIKCPFLTALLIRNLPIGNNTVTNYLAGTTTVKPISYFAGSLVGYIPQAYIFTLMGSGAKNNNPLSITLSVLLFIMLTWMMLYVFRSSKVSKKIQA